MMQKFILLTEIISPYRIAVFNEIALHTDYHFLVLFFSETVREREWRVYKRKIRFSYRILPSISFKIKGSYFPYFFNPNIFFTLVRYSPKVIIVGGYHHPSIMLAMLYAKLFKRLVILWCESNKYEYRSRKLFKEAYKRWFVRNCDGYIVPGKASFEYLLSLGAASKKIGIAPNAVDNEYFNQAASRHIETKHIFKQSKGYPQKLILYVGRLIERKGILDLLKAFQILSYKQSGLGLVIIGSGQEERRYEDFCKTNNLKNIFFEGFVQQEDLPAYYAACDVFVLPAHSDPWGLVLNEAMACSLPVISSNTAGAACDLIINGENGYIFTKGDIHQLTNYLKDLLSDDQRRIEMGRKSLEIIKDYSPTKCARGFIKAINEISIEQR